jgi:hypothetical protein
MSVKLKDPSPLLPSLLMRSEARVVAAESEPDDALVVVCDEGAFAWRDVRADNISELKRSDELDRGGLGGGPGGGPSGAWTELAAEEELSVEVAEIWANSC